MNDPIYDIKNWIDASGVMTGYEMQFDEWKDSEDKGARTIIVYSNAGVNEGDLQSNPNFRLLIVGAENDKTRGTDSIMQKALDLIEYAQTNFNQGCLAMIQPIVMPSGVGFTENRRPFTELNLTSIIT